MSKRDLKKYLNTLNKDSLEEQLLELYDKFLDVKKYYDFVFNPNETKLVHEAKSKIYCEYIAVKGKKVKMRRSVAQKLINNFLILGVDDFCVVDVMLYNLEIAHLSSSQKPIVQEQFYKSMLKSFEQVIYLMIEKNLLNEFKSRVLDIFINIKKQNWKNVEQFKIIIEKCDLE